MIKKLKNRIIRMLINKPGLKRWTCHFYKMLGCRLEGDNYIAECNIYQGYEGKWENLLMKKNSRIEAGCFLLLRDVIEIGENSTIAYNTTILTSSDPNHPYNKLSQLYPPKLSPVRIGDNVWIGACSTILEGVTIGECSIVAAGALVNKDVPPYTVVAGVPARVIKQLNIS